MLYVISSRVLQNLRSSLSIISVCFDALECVVVLLIVDIVLAIIIIVCRLFKYTLQQR